MTDDNDDDNEALRRALTAVTAASQIAAQRRILAILRASASIEDAIAAVERDTGDRAAWLDAQMAAVTLWLMAGEKPVGH